MQKPSAPPPVPLVTNTVGASGQRGAGRGSGRGTGRGRGRGSGRGKRGGLTDVSARTISQASPSDAWEVNSVGSSTATLSAPLGLAAGKKKPGPTKGTAQRAIRKKPSKAAKVVAPPPPHRDDVESVISDVGFPPTAASSPMPHDDRSPEPENPAAHLMPPPAFEDSNLEGVPVPLYPLPSKPFPVQPPPKIGTGFAPAIPLDKSGKPVRRWRQVNREVRGIAGGRWFARTWLGEKESDFASAVAATSAAALQAAQAAAAQREATQAASLSAAGLVSLPKLPPLAPSGVASAPVKGRGRGAKADAFVSASSTPRSDSLHPESITVQIPKKRKASAVLVKADPPAMSAEPSVP